MADQDSSGPSMGRRNGTPVQCSMKETSVKLAEVQVDLGGRPKAIVVKYEDDDWDLPLLPKKAASNPPKARTRERGDGAGSSKPKAPPAVVSQPKPQMTVVDVRDFDVELVLPSVSASSGGKPKAPLAVVSQPKPQMTVEVVRDDVELVLPSIFSKSRVNMKDVKAQSRNLVSGVPWARFREVIDAFVNKAPKGKLPAGYVVFDQSKERSRGGSAAKKSDHDPVALWLERCIQALRPNKESEAVAKKYFPHTKGSGMLAQNVSGTPAECKGLIAEALRAKSRRLMNPGNVKSFFSQIRLSPAVGSGFTLVFALTLERGVECSTLTKHWRVLACDGDCWTTNEGMKSQGSRHTNESRYSKDLKKLETADGGSYYAPGLWPPGKAVGEYHFLTPVQYLYSLRDVLLLPEHGPHPLKAEDGDVMDEEEFILGSSVIVTSAVGMDSLQYLKLVEEGFSVPIVRSAVTAYSNCVMAQLPRFKQIYPSVKELKNMHEYRDFTWERKFCGFRCRELNKAALEALIKDVNGEVLKILVEDKNETRDGLSDSRLDLLVGRLSYWAKILFRLKKPKEGETVFMSELSKQFRKKVCEEKRAALTKLTPEQKEQITKLTELLVDQKPLPREYTQGCKKPKKRSTSKPSADAVAGGWGDGDESGSDIEEDSKEESGESSSSSDFDPAYIDESDEEDPEYGSAKLPLIDVSAVVAKGRKVIANTPSKGKKPEARKVPPPRPTFGNALRKNAIIKKKEVAALAAASIHDEGMECSSEEDLPIGEQLKNDVFARAMAKVENSKQYLIENPLDIAELRKEFPDAWINETPEVARALVAQDLAYALSIHDVIAAVSDKPLKWGYETELSFYNQVACHAEMKKLTDNADQGNAQLTEYRAAYTHLKKVEKSATAEEDITIIEGCFFQAHALLLMRPVETKLDMEVEEREALAQAGKSTPAAVDAHGRFVEAKKRAQAGTLPSVAAGEKRKSPEEAAPEPVEYPFFREVSAFISSLTDDDELFKTVKRVAKMEERVPSDSYVSQFIFRVCKKKMSERESSDEEDSDEESSDEEASGEESSDE